MNNDLVTIKEAAKIIGRTQSYTRFLVNTGKIPIRGKIGGINLLSKKDLEALDVPDILTVARWTPLHPATYNGEDVIDVHSDPENRHYKIVVTDVTNYRVGLATELTRVEKPVESVK